MTSPGVGLGLCDRVFIAYPSIWGSISFGLSEKYRFHQYVKPDFHFLREFPQLAGVQRKMKSRDQFIVAWHLSNFLGITAFYLDHLLYELGKIWK
jgi:hypothetical protein